MLREGHAGSELEEGTRAISCSPTAFAYDRRRACLEQRASHFRREGASVTFGPEPSPRAAAQRSLRPPSPFAKRISHDKLGRRLEDIVDFNPRFKEQSNGKLRLAHARCKRRLVAEMRHRPCSNEVTLGSPAG